MSTNDTRSIVLVHGCRQVSELSYGERLVEGLRNDELFGPLLADKLHYYPTVTREPFRNRGRITDLITSEKLFDDCGLPPLDIETDRIMLCGNPAMLSDLRLTLRAARLRRRQSFRARAFRHREGIRGAMRCRRCLRPRQRCRKIRRGSVRG